MGGYVLNENNNNKNTKNEEKKVKEFRVVCDINSEINILVIPRFTNHSAKCFVFFLNK